MTRRITARFGTFLFLVCNLAHLASAQDEANDLATAQDKEVYAGTPSESPEQRRERFNRTRARLAALDSQFEMRRYSQEGTALPYRLFRPADETRDATYPLVVFFHGGGGRGTDNRRHIADAHFSARIWALPEFQSKHPCFVLAPQLVHGMTHATWQVRARCNEKSGDDDSFEGQWQLDVSGQYGRGLEFGLRLTRVGDKWSAEFNDLGPNRRSLAGMPPTDVTLSNDRLTVFFGPRESRRNNRIDLQLKGDEATGTLIRDLNRDELAGRLLGLIDSVCEELPIDMNRIYVTGLSMGGGVTWSLVGKHPEKFAAAAPICAFGQPATAQKIVEQGVEIWTCHGLDDDRVPIEATRDMVAALRRAGGSPKLTEYPGVAHDSWIDAYQDHELHDWLFTQRRGD